jgi:membrane protein DedA with SNARE-associated domain
VLPVPALRAAAVFALRVHRHVRGPRADYAGVGLAALASWAGVPGPGEAVLVTAGVLAGRHRLDIGPVLAIAWLGATAGGIGGWLVGLKAGRTVLTAPGPLYRGRLAALRRGDRFYERFGVLAVFFTPSWVAGINGMRWTRFLPANAISALVWALVIGLGAFVVGPSITEVVSDLGLVGAIVLGGLVVAALAAGLRRRRRRGSQER